MPQLVKGGKFVFGWSLVQKTGKISMPEEAFFEYDFNNCDKIVILPGSSTSGGFSIACVSQLSKGSLKEILAHLRYSEKLKTFEIPEQKVLEYKNKRFICWLKLAKSKYFTLLPEVLQVYGIEIGDKLLVCRGSGHALGFIVRGPIIETAQNHELKISI
ncbi:MAG: hypothetical protein ACFFC6_17260 [Promethearchaeota archaeon]